MIPIGGIANTTERFERLAAELAGVGQRFYQRGWVLGTSGNFSAVVATRPLEFCITPTSANKGALAPADFLLVDARGRVRFPPKGKPSAETQLHIEIINARGAGSVLHTHSIWSTILSSGIAPTKALRSPGTKCSRGSTA